MGNVKEFHYNESDIKGSSNLIEDCKNHYTYIKTCVKDNDLDIIINGVVNNLDSIEIVKQLPNVTADNLHSIMCAIKDVRNSVPIDEKPIFQKHLFALLLSFGFDLDNYKIRTKVKNRLACYDEYELLCDVLQTFVRFCNANNNDVIEMLFKEM